MSPLLGGSGNHGLCAGENLGEEEADQVEANPVGSGRPKGGSDRGLTQTTTAALRAMEALESGEAEADPIGSHLIG